jgi:hypothetical protein
MDGNDTDVCDAPVLDAENCTTIQRANEPAVSVVGTRRQRRWRVRGKYELR